MALCWLMECMIIWGWFQHSDECKFSSLDCSWYLSSSVNVHHNLFERCFGNVHQSCSVAVLKHVGHTWQHCLCFLCQSCFNFWQPWTFCAVLSVHKRFCWQDFGLCVKVCRLSLSEMMPELFCVGRTWTGGSSCGHHNRFSRAMPRSCTVNFPFTFWDFSLLCMVNDWKELCVLFANECYFEHEIKAQNR